MLTALSQDESRQRGLACGAVAYMTKPFDPEALIAAIRRHAR
jgi:DNA-binding response OmpR family regulator